MNPSFCGDTMMFGFQTAGLWHYVDWSVHGIVYDHYVDDMLISIDNGFDHLGSIKAL